MLLKNHEHTLNVRIRYYQNNRDEIDLTTSGIQNSKTPTIPRAKKKKVITN
jgi:hypothetical protein